MSDPVGKGAGDAHAEHAAQRMRDDVGLGDLQMIEQRDGVARQRVEMQVACGLEDLPKPIWSGTTTR